MKTMDVLGYIWVSIGAVGLGLFALGLLVWLVGLALAWLLPPRVQ